MHATVTTEPTAPHRRVRTVAVAVIAAAVVGLGGLALTNAYFTSQATVAGHSVSTATVVISAETSSASSPIQVTDLLPGDTVSTVITVSNTGSEDLYFSAGDLALTGDAALQDALQVTVGDGTTTHTTALSDWATGSLAGFALDAGDAVDITVSVSLSAGAGDELQGLEAGFSIVFDAIQQRNVTAPEPGFS